MNWTRVPIVTSDDIVSSATISVRSISSRRNSVVDEGAPGAIIRSERRSWFERVSTMAISVACETTIGYSQSEGERGWDPRGMLRPRRISLKTTASL